MVEVPEGYSKECHVGIAVAEAPDDVVARAEWETILEIGVLVIALLYFQPVLNFIDGLLRRMFIKGGADFQVVLENFSKRIITL